MIKKKTVSVLFAAIMMIGFSLSSAHAGGLWCHAGTVVKAGVWESIANETRSGYNISVNC